MRFIKFLLSLAITISLVLILNTHGAFGKTTLPALGKWLDPFSGFWNNTRPEATMTWEDLHLHGLSEDVSVLYDDRLVPHIFANSLEDALFVQGYLEARHRLWQMDLMSRAAAGRLAEAFGPDLVEYDKEQRRKGLAWAAEKAVTGWLTAGDEQFHTFVNYIDGINAYIDQLEERDYPVEFKLLGYQPERWSVLHSALIAKRMAQTLNSRETDLETTNTLQEIGPELFDFLFPEYNPQQAPVIPDEALNEIFAESSAPNPVGPALGGYQRPEPLAPAHLGSNNWAVAGSKTASGYPILCNDPHLQLTLPAIWFEVQMCTPDFNAYGVSVPGFPGIMIGFNEHIAWGETNVSQDVLDWYQMDWTNDQHTRYRFDGEEKEVEYRVEEIAVKGGQTIIDSVRYTHLGPVTYDDGVRTELVMRWLAHDQPALFEPWTFIGLCMAKDYEDYVAALAEYESPAQNFVFASQEGDIALWVNGKFPVKESRQGTTVSIADGSEDLWQGYIPRDQIPHVRNPESGFVSSANQHSTSPAYPFYYNGSFDDYRGRLLNRVLTQMDDITPEDMMALQTSNFSIMAEEALPQLLQHLDSTGLDAVQRGLVQLLEDWDYHFDNDSRAAILFSEWWKAFYRRAWDEFYTLSDQQSIRFPETWRTIELMSSHPELAQWDDQRTSAQESLGDLVLLAFRDMYEVLEPHLEDNTYDWGAYHQMNVLHLTRQKALSRPGLEPGGHSQALNATKGTSGPSWRMVVALGPEVKAYGVYPGGQSGAPGSMYYDQMIDTWERGGYYELYFLQNPEEAGEQFWLRQVFEGHADHHH
jgi:penicillin amidase